MRKAFNYYNNNIITSFFNYTPTFNKFPLKTLNCLS